MSPFQRDWTAPVRYVRGVGEQRAALLARLDIHTVRDLLLTLPRRYEDRRLNVPLRSVMGGDALAVRVRVQRVQCRTLNSGRPVFEATVSDGTGTAICRWYHAAYLQERLPPGSEIVIYGRAERRNDGLVFEHPEIVYGREGPEANLHMGRIVPVYPSTEGLGQKAMRKIVWSALETYAPFVVDPLPADVRLRLGLPPLKEALWQAHFPATEHGALRARERLAFDEFLCMQLVLAGRKRQVETEIEGRPVRAPAQLRRRMIESLPFQLTDDQQRALGEILEDLARTRPMHRLLQGDVGAGKTVVAAAAALDVIEVGMQVAVMAPTELLALQHYRTFARLFEAVDVKIGLLVGSLPDREKIAARAALADGRTHLVVGTHALIQESVVFKQLGLVVIDEQHKFGVEQRGRLYGKGSQPHVLVMSATPIPRTLAMTLYGDLDVTTIRSKPPGRSPVMTRVIGERALPEAYAFIRRQVERGRQAYIVYPLIDESDALEVRAAEEMFERLQRGPLNGLRLGLAHGRLPAEERDRVMEKFRGGGFDVLVATSVIEVGVDVPNATVMLVENAERFGLAQLHQLRGRIGRGEHKSYCILQGHPNTREAWQRLKILEQTDDGFRIAEEDFRLRGMGNLFGREQSGGFYLRVADPLRDVAVLELARQEAFRIVERDPHLTAPEHARLREEAVSLYRAAAPFVKVG